MALAPELLDVLACPRCRGPLENRPGEERLVCPLCRLAYPIRDGIPVLLAEKAAPL